MSCWMFVSSKHLCCNFQFALTYAEWKTDNKDMLCPDTLRNPSFKIYQKAFLRFIRQGEAITLTSHWRHGNQPIINRSTTIQKSRNRLYWRLLVAHLSRQRAPHIMRNANLILDLMFYHLWTSTRCAPGWLLQNSPPTEIWRASLTVITALIGWITGSRDCQAMQQVTLIGERTSIWKLR